MLRLSPSDSISEKIVSDCLLEETYKRKILPSLSLFSLPTYHSLVSPQKNITFLSHFIKNTKKGYGYFWLSSEHLIHSIASIPTRQPDTSEESTLSIPQDERC
jgi:hypothetical protein